MNEAIQNGYLPLEDDFIDVIGKAARGRKTTADALAARLYQPSDTVEQWFSGRAVPGSDSLAQLANLLQLRPDALEASALRTWHPQTPLPACARTYIQYSQPESNGYLLHSKNGNEVALVDPAGDVETLAMQVKQAARTLRYLFITHRHDDHSDAAARLALRYPHVEIIMHNTEAVTRAELPRLTRVLADGDRIQFDGDDVEAIVTPGHTDGSTCFRFGSVLCVGDTIFAGSVGRSNGPTATFTDHLSNIRTRIFTLPGETVLLPGHGPVTTVAIERDHNPFFPD